MLFSGLSPTGDKIISHGKIWSHHAPTQSPLALPKPRRIHLRPFAGLSGFPIPVHDTAPPQPLSHPTPHPHRTARAELLTAWNVQETLLSLHDSASTLRTSFNSLPLQTSVTPIHPSSSPGGLKTSKFLAKRCIHLTAGCHKLGFTVAFSKK